MARAVSGTSDLFQQFGRSCPVCGKPLGSPAVWRDDRDRLDVPPCFRLEIGPPDSSRNYTWRVTAIATGANFPSASSRQPTFVESDVEYVYVLCGDGHIFPQAAPVNFPDAPLADARQRVDRWNMVAAIGAPASGKTYLLIRMLNQDLNNPHNILADNDEGRILRHQLNPLEQVPLDRRSDEYHRTVLDNKAIAPTQAEETRPAMILESVLPDAVEAIRVIITKTVVDGVRRAQDWGTGFRQPLVVRTSSDELLTWTGIADLPGELFGPDPGQARERNKLRSYDALIWVIDPVVAEAALDPMTKESLSSTGEYEKVLDGSLRPGTIAFKGSGPVRAEREQTQRDIGRSLTLIGNDFAVNHGRPLEMLIAVNKCDLIHAALRKHRKLVELGRRDQVRLGVAAYLARIARRWSDAELVADPQSEDLLQYLRGARAAKQTVHEQRIFQVADGLLEHYSGEQAFWRLVHEGSVDYVDIPGTGEMTLAGRRIRVASIGEHLDQSTVRGSGERLLIRDFVMSALGCGIAFGLGHQSAIQSVLKNDWQRLRLFLCSPLATVPVGRAEISASGVLTPRLEPLDRGCHFPYIEDPSAALTQLFLAALRKARA